MTSLTRQDIEAMMRAASEVAPGPWKIVNSGIDGYIVAGDGNWIFGGERCEGFVSVDDPNAQYVCLCSPDRILALCSLALIGLEVEEVTRGIPDELKQPKGDGRA